MPTIELHIKGKVQGVFYRATAREQGEALGLTGWVRNMPDGSVLLRASGTQAALVQMEQWCWHGPEHAEVTAVVRTEMPDEAFTGFRVIR